MTYRLGKKPARPGAVKLQFGDYLSTSTLSAPPATFGHDKIIGSWPMLANDTVGCCAISDGLHQHQLWCAETGKRIPLSDAVAIKNYSAVTGYNPKDPSTDQGTDLAQLCSYRQHTGLIDGAGHRHKVGAYLALNPKDFQQLLYAIFYLDGVTIGVDFPSQWMTAFNAGNYLWDKLPHPNVEGGHAITGVASVTPGSVRIVTWGTDLVNLTQAGYEQANDEAYVFISLDRLNNNGLDINGFDIVKLRADLAALQSVSKG